MRHPLQAALLVLMLGASLAGCAPVLVGGAATGASMVHDRRSAGTLIDDQGIEFKAVGEFNKQPVLRDRSHINVTSYNGVVLLTGEVPSREAGLLAERLVKGLPQVRQVHNELIIAQVSPLSSRANDALITTQVKASLFGIRNLPDFDPTRVKVVTERGIVYLMGLLKPQEADATVETVRRINGVQQVVKLFEYI
ncbi:MAG TPA: BON domain-containing protein [Candidatus Competibacteraceae bacterium]|nr:BON domain-containing protein [Candidatus Competibacteraceae bacterium]